MKELSLHPSGEFISDQIRNHGLHYELDLLTKIRFLVDYKCFIDIGANIGNHSHFFSFYGAHGYSFEPSTRNFQLLSKNVPKFITYRTALGDSESQIQLITFHEAMGNSHISGSINSNLAGKISEVELVSLSRLDDFNIPCATLIKIDTEGFEVEVLKGAKITLSRYSPNLWIEIHEDENLLKSNALYSRSEIRNLLLENDYNYYLKLDSTNYLFSKKRKFLMKKISSFI